MAGLIIMCLVIYIIYKVSNKKKPIYPNIPYPKQNDIKEPVGNLSNIKFQITSSSNYNDPSIIDVTNQSSKIYPDSYLQKYNNGVPFWAHHYVYSYSEINSASSEQKKFYVIFKNSFLNGEYLDLEGNSNYAFILLFDLLREYDSHKDIIKLEKQLRILGQNYPKTKPYGVSFLKQKREKQGDNGGVSKLWDENKLSNQDQNTYYEDWKLGNRYQSQLKLSNEDVNILNRLFDVSNKFNSIEYCSISLINLFLGSLKYLEKYYEKNDGMSIKDEIIHSEIKKHFKFRAGSSNFKNAYDNLTVNYNQCIYKTCENKLRECLDVGRKTDLSWYFHSAEAIVIFDKKVSQVLSQYLHESIGNLNRIDDQSEIELNNYNRSRYKKILKNIFDEFKLEEIQIFRERILGLEKLNMDNPFIENIYFEASKFIAKYHNLLSLEYYIKYIYYDLKSTTFDNKQLAKTIQKSLFKTNEQLHDFEKIVSELITDKDLDKALANISKIYEVKRKKIQLDTATIREVQQQHSGTVELLNEYLNDDFEDEENNVKSQEINSEEIKIEITPKNEVNAHSAFLTELALKPIHITTLELFAKSNFAVPQSEIAVFAKSNGIFKNQLIESINDTCYEFLDDILIEEEDDFYTINDTYFQRISTK